jgi:regulatory protein
MTRRAGRAGGSSSGSSGARDRSGVRGPQAERGPDDGPSSQSGQRRGRVGTRSRPGTAPWDREFEGTGPGDPDDGPEKDDPESVARIICLRMLTAAPRTQAELATALRRRGVPDEAAQAVLARFAEVKLIDDAMFARAWVETRHHSRGLAGRALGAELRRRGVARDDIDSALEELDPEQELVTARELVDRRLAGTRSLPAPARMRRLVGMLARKGYSPSLAYRVVREALEHEADQAGRTPYYLADIQEPVAEDGEVAEDDEVADL